jgi:hypothetical protein
MSHFTGPNPHGFALAGAFVGAAAGLFAVDLLREASFASARSRISRSIRHLDNMRSASDAIRADAAAIERDANDVLADIFS